MPGHIPILVSTMIVSPGINFDGTGNSSKSDSTAVADDDVPSFPLCFDCLGVSRGVVDFFKTFIALNDFLDFGADFC